MSTTATPVEARTGVAAQVEAQAGKVKKRLTSPWASLAAMVIAILWTIPTVGLLITSIRPQIDIQTSGWWTWFSNPSFTTENYKDVLESETSGTTLAQAFINSVVITLPAVVIPLVIYNVRQMRMVEEIR